LIIWHPFLWSRNYQPFMESKMLLLFSHKPVIGPSVDSRNTIITFFFKNHFNIIFQSTWASFLKVLLLKFCTVYYLSRPATCLCHLDSLLFGSVALLLSMRQVIWSTALRILPTNGTGHSSADTMSHFSLILLRLTHKCAS
jgi:hypothetical protein